VNPVVLGSIQKPLQALCIPGPAVGVESLALRFVEATAMILAAAAPGRKLDIRAALRAGIGAESSSLYRLLFQCTQTHGHSHKEDCAAALKAIRSIVDSVDRNVNCTARQIVVARVTSYWRLRPLGQSRKLEGVAAVTKW